MDKMREEFEIWADLVGYDLLRADADYDDSATENAWSCWQHSWRASRAAIEIDMNISTVGIHGRFASIAEITKQLNNAGVKTKNL
ncbi:hypothetical protein [Pantoea cypripedii]|uniref:Uncharacterized protein n=1 Tax=Pantoea cypripedii TaxID=55209 RepID=A0A6B9G9L0_PANCY|nr:hypothetical protein [Pantoea cypripedii]QGY32553.1 hypothetical protein CUN67_26705 [Pantoea cypripedii]